MTVPAQNSFFSSRLLACLRSAAAVYFLFTLYALFFPHPHLEVVGIPTFSFIHIAAFFVLGALVEAARGQIPFLPVFTILLIYGPLTECLQPITGRCFEWVDILQDSIGITIGVLTITAVKTVFRGCSMQKQKETPLTGSQNPVESDDVKGQ